MVFEKILPFQKHSKIYRCRLSIRIHFVDSFSCDAEYVHISYSATQFYDIYNILKVFLERISVRGRSMVHLKNFCNFALTDAPNSRGCDMQRLLNVISSLKSKCVRRENTRKTSTSTWKTCRLIKLTRQTNHSSA